MKRVLSVICEWVMSRMLRVTYGRLRKWVLRVNDMFWR